MAKDELTYRQLFRDIVLELNTTRDAIDVAAGIQWRKPPTSVEDAGTRRSRGGYSDPTGETVVDERRLAVRRAVQQGERVLRHSLTSIRGANDALLVATKAWGRSPWDSE